MTTQRILIVDDDEDLIELFEISLESAGFDVASCMKSADVINQCKTFSPNLVLMDLSLPGTSGDVLFGQMKDLGINTPLAFLTAETNKSKKDSLLASGAIDVLVKPLRPAELIAAVERLLAN